MDSTCSSDTGAGAVAAAAILSRRSSDAGSGYIAAAAMLSRRSGDAGAALNSVSTLARRNSRMIGDERLTAKVAPEATLPATDRGKPTHLRARTALVSFSYLSAAKGFTLYSVFLRDRSEARTPAFHLHARPPPLRPIWYQKGVRILWLQCSSAACIGRASTCRSGTRRSKSTTVRVRSTRCTVGRASPQAPSSSTSWSEA